METNNYDGRITEEEQKSVKNIGTKWLDSLFNSIERITEHERLGREGCESLVQFVQNFSYFAKMLPSVQLKNLSMMIGEIKILLPKAKHLINKESYKQFKIDIKKCDIDFNNQYVYIKEIKYSVCHTSKGKRSSSHLFLKQGFGLLFERVVEIKARLLDDLDDILFPKVKIPRQRES